MTSLEQIQKQMLGVAAKEERPRSKASSKLLLWMDENALSQKDVAEQLDIPVTQMSRYMNGNIPKLPLAHEFYELTGGFVGYGDWLEENVDEEEEEEEAIDIPM